MKDKFTRDPWIEYWMKQSEEYRRAVKFGEFILNQPELPLEWEPIVQQEAEIEAA